MAEQSLRWCAWCNSPVKPCEAGGEPVDTSVPQIGGKRAGGVATKEFPPDRCPHCGNATFETVPNTMGRPAHCPSVWEQKS